MVATPQEFSQLNVWAIVKTLAVNGIGPFVNSGAPTNGTSGTLAGYAGPGAILIDISNKIVYVNTNTKASPTWSTIGSSTTLVNATLTTPTITNPTITGPVPVTVTGSSVTLGATHVGRTTVLSRAAGAGTAVTLPAATGSGDKYRLVVGIASNSNTIATAPTTDFYAGGTLINDIGDTTAATADFFPTAATSNLLSPTTAGGGGLVGDWIELEDFLSGFWSIRAVFAGATDPSNRFSHV